MNRLAAGNPLTRDQVSDVVPELWNREHQSPCGHQLPIHQLKP